MGEKERMLHGELCFADDPDLATDPIRCDRILAAFTATRAASATSVTGWQPGPRPAVPLADS